ncbi:MAG: copper resistance D family protein [Gemmatimonadales bacterium]
MNTGLLALYAAVRGVIYVGLLLLVGTPTAASLLAGTRHDPELDGPLRDRLAQLPRWILSGLIVAILLRGALQLVSFLDPGDVITTDLIRSALLSGGWGHAWLLQLLTASIALAVLAYRGNRVSTPDLLTAVLTAVLLWAQTGMGHAAGDTWPVPLGRLLDFAHLAGAGLWLGTLAVLLVTALPLLYPASRLPALASVVRAFSVYARAGALLVLVSGSAAALVYAHGSIGMMLHSTWGRLLLIKLGGLLGVVAIGWYNWRIVTPALERRDADAGARLRRAVRVEIALGLLMLAITTLLVVSPLPGES